MRKGETADILALRICPWGSCVSVGIDTNDPVLEKHSFQCRSYHPKSRHIFLRDSLQYCPAYFGVVFRSLLSPTCRTCTFSTSAFGEVQHWRGEEAEDRLEFGTIVHLNNTTVLFVFVVVFQEINHKMTSVVTMRSALRFTTRLARSSHGLARPSAQGVRQFSVTSSAFESYRDGPMKPIMARKSDLGAGTLLAAVVAALLAGFGIATYTTNASSADPIDILSERRVLSPKYATLSEMEKVSSKRRRTCLRKCTGANPVNFRRSKRSVPNSATVQTLSPLTQTTFTRMASQNGPQSISKIFPLLLHTLRVPSMSASSPAFATSAKCPSYRSAAVVVSKDIFRHLMAA